MSMRMHTNVCSFFVSIALIGCVCAIASIPIFSAMWILLLPGAFLSAIIFPQGIHSDHGIVFLVLAGLFDIGLLTFVLIGLRMLIGRKRKDKR